jgi:DASH complex subunit ASK1
VLTCQFWRTFFEAAASTRVPTSDLSTLTSAEDTFQPDDLDDHTVTLRPEDSYVEGETLDFQPAAAGATTSTPMPVKTAGAYDESWSDSMESPFDRLDRKLRDGLRLEEEHESSGMPTPSLPSGYDLPGLDDTSLNVSVPTLSRPEPSSATPKAARALRPADSKANAAPSGVVDLRSTPLNAKFKPKSKPGFKPPKLSLADLESELADDDFKMTMSPPVTMTFNLPARAAAIHAVAASRQTPVAAPGKEAEAKLILDDLMEEMESFGSPRMDTPEGLRRYSVLPTEMAGGAARQLFPAPIEALGEDAMFHASGSARPTRRSMANTSFGSDVQDVPEHVVYSNDETFDGSDDSFDFVTGAASVAPVGVAHDLLADDSYLSDLGSPLHPGGQADLRGDMTFSTQGGTPDRSEAGVIFGGPTKADGRFALMKPDEMMTFHGGRLEDAAAQDSPTNLMRR